MCSGHSVDSDEEADTEGWCVWKEKLKGCPLRDAPVLKLAVSDKEMLPWGRASVGRIGLRNALRAFDLGASLMSACSMAATWLALSAWALVPVPAGGLDVTAAGATCCIQKNQRSTWCPSGVRPIIPS